MKYFLAILFFICLSITSNAQGFMKGILITSNGDSLSGRVNPMKKFLLFQDDRNGDISRYKFKEVPGFIVNDQLWVLKEAEVLNGTFPERVNTYMKVVVDGPVRLLEFNGNDYYGGPHSCYLIEVPDQAIYRVEKSNFDKRMSEYFKSYEALAKQIKEGTLIYSQMPVIIVLFNEWWNDTQQPQD